MRISDWSSDVCSSDLGPSSSRNVVRLRQVLLRGVDLADDVVTTRGPPLRHRLLPVGPRSEERRVGKAWGRTCRSVWSTYHYKNKQESSINDINNSLQMI